MRRISAILACLALFAVACDDETAGSGSEKDASLLTCEVGETKCVGDRIATCLEDGSWLAETCENGTCVNGECSGSSTTCTPGETKCVNEQMKAVCLSDGTWLGIECNDSTCKEGECVGEECVEGEKRCSSNVHIATCDSDGAWVSQKCPNDMVCEEDDCVVPVVPRVCEEGASYCDEEGLLVSCVENAWQSEECDNGFVCANDTCERDLTQVLITPIELENAESGSEYSVTFEAIGGTAPYVWSKRSGDLPQGLELTSDGVLSGVPLECGTFNFMLRVIDDDLHKDEANFSLTVDVAPLEISGGLAYSFNLSFLGMSSIGISVLDLLLPVVPYTTQLSAKGGIPPYTWSIGSLNGILASLVPNAGLPDGLALNQNGTIMGSVADIEAAFSFDIPFVNVTLAGYFFQAQVCDSEPGDAMQCAAGIFLIPTSEIDLGSLGGLIQ